MSKVLSIDLEANQPSGKIIQVGYVIASLDKPSCPLVARSFIVDPREPLGAIPQTGVHISDFTGITQERIDKEGMSLYEAYDLLLDDVRKFNPTRTPVQWGDGAEDNKGDHDWLRRELGLSWNDFIFRPRAWDVKSLYQIYRAFDGKNVIGGVSKALEDLSMHFEGRPHDALADAINTLRIFTALGKKMVLADKIEKLIL
jgi:inhibitor of KinA sporulation pathway (predicted exonuclease)